MFILHFLHASILAVIAIDFFINRGFKSLLLWLQGNRMEDINNNENDSDTESETNGNDSEKDDDEFGHAFQQSCFFPL